MTTKESLAHRLENWILYKPNGGSSKATPSFGFRRRGVETGATKSMNLPPLTLNLTTSETQKRVCPACSREIAPIPFSLRLIDGTIRIVGMATLLWFLGWAIVSQIELMTRPSMRPFRGSWMSLTTEPRQMPQQQSL